MLALNATLEYLPGDRSRTLSVFKLKLSDDHIFSLCNDSDKTIMHLALCASSRVSYGSLSTSRDNFFLFFLSWLQLLSIF